MPIIDTHQHLWDPSRFSYSWMADLPTLNRAHLIEEYRSASTDLNITGSVYIDTDVDQQDLPSETALIFALADEPSNNILGVVPNARLELENCFAHLERFWSHPKLKGVRRVLHTQADEIFDNPRFRKHLAELPERGLSFDLCVSSTQLPLALALIERNPRLSIILDHCGGPSILPPVLEPWRAHIRAISQHPNVVCKISGIVASIGAQPWSSETLRPFIEHVIECFGWDRVLWGSDWPVCTLTCSLKTWLETAQAITQSATTEEREQLFWRNATRVYRLAFPPTAS